MKESKKIYLEVIIREAGKLEFLVNDFLGFSRLQTGRLELSFSATSLDKELMWLFELYQTRASQTGIKLELQMDEPLPTIMADTSRLHRVFTNLLDNALKFSNEKGRITIATHETDQDVIVKIIDQGTGINPRDVPYIFEPFHRGRGGGKREGFGLGLAVVKAIVEGHGGRVILKSELGKGSVFTVVLPKARKSEDGMENM
jgi:signal transduction histidine kinase